MKLDGLIIPHNKDIVDITLSKIYQIQYLSSIYTYTHDMYLFVCMDNRYYIRCALLGVASRKPTIAKNWNRYMEFEK